MSPAPPPSQTARRLAWATCIAIGLLFLYPILTAYRYDFEGFAFANESIAYRWGHASRIISGDVPPILPQGFTILAVQEQIVRAIEAFLPPSAATLRPTLLWFCWGTSLVFIAGFVTVLANLARSPRETPDRLVFVFLPWIAATWATGTAGLYYSLLPDYYYLNAILACAVGWRLLPFLDGLQRDRPAAPGWPSVIFLGVALGLGVANKVTWGIPCVVAFGAVVLASSGGAARRLACGAVLAATATLTLALVLLIHYQFSPRIVAQGIKEWLSFMQGQRGEFALGSPAFYAMMRSYNYDVLYALGGATAIACVGLVSGWKARVFALGSLVGFALLLWAAAQRPAGSTLWDINVLLLMMMSASVLAIASSRRRLALLAVWGLALGALIVRQPPRFNGARFAATHTASTNRFEVFEEISRFAGDRPQFVMLVNNEYGHGGVHELLLKAASDFPTWNVSVGRAWLKNFGADITFLHEYGTDMMLPADPSGICVVWYDRPDLPLLTSRYEQLAALARDPANEILSLPIYQMSMAAKPSIQVWVHALRRKTNAPYKPTIAPALVAPPILAPATEVRSP